MRTVFARAAPPVSLVALLLLLAGCDETPVAPDRLLPQPETVALDEIDEPVAPAPDSDDTAEALYFYVYDGNIESNAAQNAPPALLDRLVENGFDLQAAWDPILESVQVACMAPNVHPALVVELQSPDRDILNFGFIADPGDLEPPVYPNCGIEQFRHYSFE